MEGRIRASSIFYNNCRLEALARNRAYVDVFGLVSPREIKHSAWKASMHGQQGQDSRSPNSCPRSSNIDVYCHTSSREGFRESHFNPDYYCCAYQEHIESRAFHYHGSSHRNVNLYSAQWSRGTREFTVADFRK